MCIYTPRKACIHAKRHILFVPYFINLNVFLLDALLVEFNSAGDVLMPPAGADHLHPKKL